MSKKDFDSVKLMRDIRDKLSEKFLGMSLKEQQEYIKKYIKTPHTPHIS
ncbi:MAG: hypothetical protein ACTSQI_07150 [Candidatus Helarchaeota archaeon]